MPPQSHSPAMEGIRDHARREHWKKFDTIVSTLIAMDASPTDLNERLRFVLESNAAEIERVDQVEMGGAVANTHLDNASSGIATSKEAGHDPAIKAEDDEQQVRNLNGYHNIGMGSISVTVPGQRKRKATATLDQSTRNGRGKRLAQGRSGNHSASQLSDHVGHESSRDSSYEPPYPADRAPVPAAHIYRDENGVYMRRTDGWQFRQFKGTTKVWYEGKWRPLIRDQPSFMGVREGKGGWIVPVMAGSRGLSKRWEQQGKVEFNS